MLGEKPLTADMAIDLYRNLIIARKLYLQPALSEAVKSVGVITIDAELHQLVKPEALNHVAQLGLRGELVFPVPSIITHTPSLLGYYRMLLGFSKKEYHKRGFYTWITAEENQTLSPIHRQTLPDYCALLIEPLTQLVLAMDTFQDRDLNDLALLTLGPTLQGGRNNVIGSKAEELIFQILRQIIEPWITYEKGPIIRFTTPKGKVFELRHSSDPDIRLRLESKLGIVPILALEIKGGSDASNAYNRGGEAEKSHLKAVIEGYTERWTIIRTHGQRERIKQGTPSSTQIFEFDEVTQQSSSLDWLNFRQRFLDVIDMSDVT